MDKQSALDLGFFHDSEAMFKKNLVFKRGIDREPESGFPHICHKCGTSHNHETFCPWCYKVINESV